MKNCTICQHSFPAFEAYGIPEKIGRCPVCGGKSRSRAVAWYYEQELAPTLKEGARVLEIGASKVGVRYLRAPRFLGPARHTTVDLVRKEIHEAIRPPHEFIQMDATKLGFADQTFDFVTCNHALGFIPDFRKALREIRRVLKPRGSAMLNTPLHQGPTLTAAEIRARNPHLSENYFEENGTAWHFGDDYFEELKAAGFEVRELRPFAKLSPEELARGGLKAEEPLFVARPR
jgi:SAM-dependent methyltransferase